MGIGNFIFLPIIAFDINALKVAEAFVKSLDSQRISAQRRIRGIDIARFKAQDKKLNQSRDKSR